MGRVITLLTDFGYDSYFVPSMKGVILSINPNATIIDITHAIPPFNIFKAAFTLWASYKYFPRGTIHVVVVDPGVGTSRRALAIKTRNYYFVGPDNGVLMMAAEDDGIEEVRSIENRTYMRPTVSSTFHGRDVFAPVAAYMSLGLDISLLGPRVTDPVRLPIPPTYVTHGLARTAIIYIDHFGNAYTGVRSNDVPILGLDYGDELAVSIPRKNIELRVRFLRSYGFAKEGEALALINSEGFLELSINRGNFASKFGVEEGDEVVISVIK
ncbi:MAG: S-adenosyl-l-methionine hydroxide adenosyltransferase family protein [Vulcanisaeta sp.]|nr:S-adenosyl-l-methionine hydroxide adenosyltransferase family protein [Vulcanisaeta sp.]